MSHAEIQANKPQTAAKQDGSTEQDLIARRQRLLGPAYRLFYERPVHLVRGQGVWLYDQAGEAYLDAYNNVPVVGHCHPRIVQALYRQSAILNTHTRYLDETVLDYAEALLATFPAGLDQAMFTCSGSESNDLALRLARNYTGGTGIIITDYAYHGGTTSTAEVSPSLGAAYHQPDHVVRIPAPDAYRASGAAASNAGDASVGAAFAQNVERAVKQLQSRGIKPAALLLDTVFSSDGLFVDPAGFLAPAVDMIRKAGGVFIADEVQGGFGRSGSHMWNFQRHGLVPDIVTMGKPMGNGHPVAGLVARAPLLDAFGRDCRYFNTFGGNPVSSMVGLTVLNIIREERLMQNATDVGAYLRQQLAALMEQHPVIGDVRGAGLFIGLELITDRGTSAPDGALAVRIVNAMRERRILISAAGPSGNVLKIRPPLPFSRANADQFLQTLDDCLKSETA